MTRLPARALDRDVREGLAALRGENAAGLSPSAITRLTSSWQEEHRAWRTRPLADRDYVYVWAAGVHFNVRLEDNGSPRWW